MKKKELTMKQAAGIGAKIGFLPVLCILVLILSNDVRDGELPDLYFMLLTISIGIGVILCGVISTLLGYALRKTETVIAIAAILGTALGSFAGFVLLVSMVGQ